jgi:hypothetical protein
MTHIELLPARGPARLGHQVEHDPRSLAYSQGVLPKAALKAATLQSIRTGKGG